MEALDSIEPLDEPLPDIASPARGHEIVDGSSSAMLESVNPPASVPPTTGSVGQGGVGVVGGVGGIAEGSVAVPFLRGHITAGDSEVNKQKMIWSGEWMMKETDKVRI